MKSVCSGHVDAVWPGAKPNDWTLRNAFNNIIENGQVRETIIPLLFQVNLKVFTIITIVESIISTKKKQTWIRKIVIISGVCVF